MWASAPKHNLHGVLDSAAECGGDSAITAARDSATERRDGEIEAPLSAAEAALLREVRGWQEANAATSKRGSVGVGEDVPYRLVRAAIAETTGIETLSSAW